MPYFLRFSSLFLDLPHSPQRPCVLCSVLRGPTANFLESFESRTATTAKRSTATRTRGATHAHAQAGPRYPLALGQQLKDGELKIVSRLARAHALVSLSSSRRSSDTVIAASQWLHEGAGFYIGIWNRVMRGVLGEVESSSFGLQALHGHRSSATPSSPKATTVPTLASWPMFLNRTSPRFEAFYRPSGVLSSSSS